MKSYRIRYNHTSTQRADSAAQADRMVRREIGDSPRIVSQACADGTYYWRSAADQDRDPDGSRAAAVVESPAQQEGHA